MLKRIDIEKYKIETICEYVKLTTDDAIKKAIEKRGVSKEEYEKRVNKKNRIETAIQECVYGDLNDKLFVKDHIRTLLENTYGIDQDNIDFAIHFNKPEYLSVQDKFDILLYLYKKDFGKAALTKFIKNHKLDKLRNIDGEIYYCITKDDIERIFDDTDIELSFEDKKEILIQKIYSLKYGYHCIDEILYMSIDGVSGGVSGLPEILSMSNEKTFDDEIQNVDFNEIPKSYDSIWIYFQGKSIHLDFLTFGNYEMLQNICEKIFTFNNPGELPISRGFVINKMKDGSRVVVMRPDFCESWCFFVRKFEAPDKTLKGLIDYATNNELVIKLISFLMKGGRTCAITGQQGTGKTTMILAVVAYIYAFFNLRVLEMAFELAIRKRFPKRNVATVQETPTIKGQEGLDTLKKTDGSVNIIGEVATHPVASYMVQSAQVASLFTLFSHHAKKPQMLVKALRNSLLADGLFKNETIAEEQVVSILNFDIHLKSKNGFRYIERITEFIPALEEDYCEDFKSQKSFQDMLSSFLSTVLTFFKKSTDRKLYTYRNIVEYDLENHTFMIRNPITPQNLEEMKDFMIEDDSKAFDEFLKEYPALKENRG